MDDVRVHYNSPRPAPLQALAYTQGPHIHLGPGQEEHLTHEAWHAVQQKQGRVIPTLRLRENSLNDDPALEREADVMGTRAMAEQSREAGPALQPGTQPQGEVVQRRVGFEFEAAGGWFFEGHKTDEDSWQGISHTKATLLPTPNNLGNISADNGNVEFRTEPLSTLQEVTDTVTELLGLRNRFRGRITQLADGEKAFALGKVNAAANLYNEVRVRAGQGLTTRPQATLGVKLVDIPALFRKLVEIRGNEPGRASQARLLQNFPGFHPKSLQRIVAGGVQENATAAIADAGGIYQRAVATAAAAGTAEPVGVSGEILGLLTMVTRVLHDAFTASPNIPDMKYAFPLMARTDLRHMFTSLEANAQAFLGTLWNAGNGPLADEIHAWDSLDRRIFPQGYRGDDGQPQQGPTKREWLRSIFEAGQQNVHGKDALSPAPGYNRLEGFGSLGVDAVDPKLALLEFRGLATFAQTATIGSDDWLILAQTFFNLTDSVLNPPPADAADVADDVAMDVAVADIPGPGAAAQAAAPVHALAGPGPLLNVNPRKRKQVTPGPGAAAAPPDLSPPRKKVKPKKKKDDEKGKAARNGSG